MNFKRTLLIFLLIGFSQNFFATNPDLKKGIQEYENDRYHNAIPYLETALEQDSTNAEAMFKLGVCYMHIFSFKESLELLQKAVSIDPEVDEFSQYWIGRAHHENRNFDEAIKQYEVYLEEYTNEKDTRRKEIEKLISQAKVGKELTANPKYYIIENVGENINSPYHEHSPMLTMDGKTMIFTSQREFEGHHAQDPDGHFYETIFMSKKGEDGEWQAAEPFSATLDHEHSHDACIQLFDNDTKMIVYRQTHQGDFYVSEFEGGEWKAPKPIEGINTGSYEVDASISSDGKTMYFATDKYTNERHIDLYYAIKKDDGEWGEAIPLDVLNSPNDENAPFISKDGKTLYFCSNGDKSMGGYDVFKSEKTADGSWGAPINLGVPINSMDDDIHFFDDINTSTKYFASHRENGFGELDIFSATPVPFVEIDGQLISSVDNNLIEDDTIQVLFNSVDGTNFEYSSGDSLKAGKFKPNVISANTYELLVLKKGDTLYKETFEVPLAEGEKTVVKKDIVIDYEVPKAMPTNPVLVMKETGGVLKVGFAYDSSELTDEAKKSLDENFKNNEGKDVTIHIIGHTDAKGTEAYNLKLSKRRAKSVAKYLTELGYAKEKVTSEGKGESEPIASNDTDEGRADNRRVEINIK